MNGKITENAIEQLAIELLAKQGYSYTHGAELAPDAASHERASFSDVFLEGRLRAAVARLNPSIPLDAQEQAVKEVLRISPLELLAAVASHAESLITAGYVLDCFASWRCAPVAECGKAMGVFLSGFTGRRAPVDEVIHT